MPDAFAEDATSRDLLRFITCGSVDDGKSTLLGRLLLESRQVFEDQLAAVTRDSRKHGTTGEAPDLALLVDGLEAEREQGITIDVAYRYFATARRAFIAADTPGHEQHTRNMATGASTADLAVILVDARKGVLAQTRRHAIICSMLGIRATVLAVNKMDLVGYAEDAFDAIVADFSDFARGLGYESVQAIPLAARDGDNVTVPSSNMPWYGGPTLLAHLETVEAGHDAAEAPFRFPVQWVNRPDESFRGLCGTVASGRVRAGDPIVAAATGAASTVARIVTWGGDRTEAVAGDAVTLVLADEIDAARGDVLAHPATRPETTDQFAAQLLWMSEEPMLQGRSYLMRLGTATVPASITALKHRVDVNTLEPRGGRTLALNEIGMVNVATTRPVSLDPYAENRRMGAFILIDRMTNATAGAGMVAFGLRRATNIHRQHHAVTKAARSAQAGHASRVVWFTGLSGSGKSSIANLVEQALHVRGVRTMLLDGDNVRHGLNRDLGFTDADRVENIRRVGEVAKLMTEAGLVVLCCFISPFEAERRMVREMLDPGEFVEVFVDVPVEECARRDPKGLYAKVQSGQLKNFTGVDSPYERPSAPELTVDGMAESAEGACARIVAWLGL
jgi:bifunctional enzyme CysN/CysC